MPKPDSNLTQLHLTPVTHGMKMGNFILQTLRMCILQSRACCDGISESARSWRCRQSRVQQQQLSETWGETCAIKTTYSWWWPIILQTQSCRLTQNFISWWHVEGISCWQ